MGKRRIVQYLTDPGSVMMESFADGVAGILDIGGTLGPAGTDADDDAAALQSDWSAVAADMYSAIEQATS